MLKCACFKVQVQLSSKKGSVVLPCSTNQKSQVQFFCRFLNRPKLVKIFGCAEEDLCVTLCEI